MKKHINGTCAGCGCGLGERGPELTWACIEGCCEWCSKCGPKAVGHGGVKQSGEVMSAKVMRRIVKRCNAMFGE